MPSQWSLQDAKNKFSEVVEAARRGAPQLVTRRGVPAVVVVDAGRFERMARCERMAQPGFAQFLLAMPTGPEPDEPRPEITLRPVDW